MKRLLEAAVITTVLMVAGCASYVPRPIEPEATAQAFERRTLDDPGLTRFLRANGILAAGGAQEWDLDALTYAALYYHPELDVARAQEAVADAAVRTAGQRPLPGVQLPLGYNADAGGLSPWLFGIALDIPIETAGKRGYRVARAQQLSRAASLRLAGVGWQVRSRVRARLLDEYAARQTQAVLQQQAEAQAEMLAMLEARVTVGEAAGPDAALLRINLQQARVALAAAQRQRGDARMQLAAAVGMPANALDGVPLNYDSLRQSAAIPPRAVQRAALRHRADLLAALADYEASQAALQGEIAKQTPDINLGPGYKWDQGADKFTLGLSLPVFGFLSQRGPIAEAEARRTEAADRFLALQARAIGEVERATGNVTLARVQVVAADRVLAEQQRRLVQVERRFAAGEIDRLQRVSARLGVQTAAQGALDAAIALQQTVGVLEDAMQQPLASVSPRALPVETNPRAAVEDQP